MINVIKWLESHGVQVHGTGHHEGGPAVGFQVDPAKIAEVGSALAADLRGRAVTLGERGVNIMIGYEAVDGLAFGEVIGLDDALLADPSSFRPVTFQIDDLTVTGAYRPEPERLDVFAVARPDGEEIRLDGQEIDGQAFKARARAAWGS